MGSGAQDSIWIREINTIKAERDKAIADRDRIRRILRERDAVGQWQIDELLRRLEYEKEATMNEFNLEARWVKFAERWPEAEETVLARDSTGNNIGAAYAEDDGCYDKARVLFNGEYYMRKDDLRNWEWLEVKEEGGEE